MGRPVDALKLINEKKMKINAEYDMRLHNILEIKDNSNCLFSAINNAFVFGYVQGVKAQKKGRAYRG